ncbi:MAG: hypothetical protein IT462_10155 [Planctomycetes bacterium]|nr:hypothetical protein [Planctomycetota bacterium]
MFRTSFKLAIFAFLALPLFAPVRAQDSAPKAESPAPANVKPYVARLIGDSVRARGGAGLAHVPVHVFAKNDEVTVWGERDGWVEIELPANASCWVATEFAQLNSDGKTYTITSDRVNLRPEASTDQSPIGQIGKGRQVGACMDGQTGKPVTSEKFVRVIPPSEARGYVAKEYTEKVREIAPEKMADKPVVKPVATPADLEDEKKTFAELKMLLKDEMAKTKDKMDLGQLRKMFEQFAEFALDEANKKEAEGIIGKIDVTIGLIDAEKKRIADEGAKAKAEQDRIKNAALAKPEEPKDVGPVVYIAKGTIGSTGKLAKTPASHRLNDDKGNTLYDLRWDGGDLSKLWGKYVGVTGEIKEYEGWPNKVIVIKRVDVLIEDDDK